MVGFCLRYMVNELTKFLQALHSNYNTYVFKTTQVWPRPQILGSSAFLASYLTPELSSVRTPKSQVVYRPIDVTLAEDITVK